MPTTDPGLSILSLPLTSLLADEDVLALARPSGTSAPGTNLRISAADLRRQLTQNPTYSLTKADVGLGNVDNTADANKPVSGPVAAAIQAARNAAAPAWLPLTAAELNADKQAYAGLLERAVLLLLVNGQTGPTPAPAAPTLGQVDDTGDTFSGAAVSGFPTLAEYEGFGFPETFGTLALTTANAYQSGQRIYLKAITGPRAAGAVGFRVAASGSRPAGAFLTNAEPFTGTTTTPAAPILSNASFTAA